jgi:ribosomal protein S18 acetylase RimI-like enzyme
MQRLISRSWSLEKPHVNVHVGDLEWWAALEREEPDVISLWYAGDELVGWAWLSPPAELDTHIHSDHRAGPLFEEMLDWFEATASRRSASPEECVAFPFDPDAQRRQLMESRDYRPVDHGYIHHARSLMDPLADPGLSQGFALRHVQGPEDIERRVAVHRSAFAPSRMTPERYRRVMASGHYRPELDWVAVASTGEFASFCNIWLDGENAVALLEPVGTADGYRRMGLARAACLAAMRAARQLGADTAIVLSADDNPGSLALYRSLGFEESGRTYRFTKSMK